MQSHRISMRVCGCNLVTLLTKTQSSYSQTYRQIMMSLSCSGHYYNYSYFLSFGTLQFTKQTTDDLVFCFVNLYHEIIVPFPPLCIYII